MRDGYTVQADGEVREVPAEGPGASAAAETLEELRCGVLADGLGVRDALRRSTHPLPLPGGPAQISTCSWLQAELPPRRWRPSPDRSVL